MNGFYVFGGGMGHLARVRKFIDYKKIENFKVFTGNNAAYHFFDSQEIVFFEVKSKDLRMDLRQYHLRNSKKHSFKNFYVDCFPGGILNELSPELFHTDHLFYLARHIRNESYDFNNVSLKYDRCFQFEELSIDQNKFCTEHTIKASQIDLPVILPDIARTNDLKKKYPTPIWLIVHSSNIDEIALLVLIAKRTAERENKTPQLILLTDQDYRDNDLITINNEWRSVDYFPIAEKIFSGAGFNTVMELKPYAEKHVCIPFERKYDDQNRRMKKIGISS
ncbi:MAG: hypothetical protein WBA74_13830 [Cyclobacteriaceae bacterium]